MNFFRLLATRLLRAWRVLLGQDGKPPALPPPPPMPTLPTRHTGTVSPPPPSPSHSTGPFSGPTLIHRPGEDDELVRLVPRGEEPPPADGTGIFQRRPERRQPERRPPEGPPPAAPARKRRVKITVTTLQGEPVTLEEVATKTTALFGGHTRVGVLLPDGTALPGEPWEGEVVGEEGVAVGRGGNLVPQVTTPGEHASLPLAIVQLRVTSEGVEAFRDLTRSNSQTKTFHAGKEGVLDRGDTLLIYAGDCAVFENMLRVRVEVLS